MKKFCNPNPDHYDQIKKMIDDMKSKIISRKNILKLIDQNKNYVKLMDTIYKILDHFCKNYKKFFS